jgi:hypothetical protein
VTAWTADELMATVFPEPKWAVPGLLCEGMNLLAGAPKVGKSWMALGLGVAVASGGRALGTIHVDQGGCLYLALEDTGRRLQDRLGKVLQGAPAPAGLTLATDCETLNDGGIERIETWLRANGAARLVIVDVFTKIRGPVSEKTNAYAADYAAVGRLKDLADDYSVAFLLLHHTRKGAAEDFLDTVSGTQGLAGASDAVLVLARSRGAANAVLHVTGRDIEEAQHALGLDPVTLSWRLLDGPASDYEISAERRAIVAAVRDNEGIGPKAIAELSGVAYAVVKHLVRKMVDDDQLDTDGAGHYLPVHPVHPVHLSVVNGVNEVNEAGEGCPRP